MAPRFWLCCGTPPDRILLKLAGLEAAAAKLQSAEKCEKFGHVDL